MNVIYIVPLIFGVKSPLQNVRLNVRLNLVKREGWPHFLWKGGREGVWGPPSSNKWRGGLIFFSRGVMFLGQNERGICSEPGSDCSS